MASYKPDSWDATFPADPEAEPRRFFHRLTILALSNYLYGRKCLPREAFKRRTIEGQKFNILNPAERGGEHFWTPLKTLSSMFNKNEIESLVIIICSKDVSNPIESLIFNFTESNPTTTPCKDPLNRLKNKVFEQLKSISAVAHSLRPISETYFPLKFQFRYRHRHEPDTTAKGTPSADGFERVPVDPNLHHLFGRGANKVIFKMNLDNGEGIEISCYTTLIQSFSEISDEVTQFEQSIADDTFMNSTLNL